MQQWLTSADMKADTEWPGYWCPVCGNVDENHQPMKDVLHD